jgi:phage repressor protein C with HTH and peptisase S24 domain
LHVIGKNIRKIRIAKNLTQEQIASKAKIDRTSLSDIERGKVPDPGYKKIIAIARALKVSTEELLGLKPSSRITPLPLISKAIGSPEGAFFTDQDFPPGAGEQYYEIDDPGAFVLMVEGNSMEPTVRAGDQVIVTPNKKCRPGDICVVRLADSGKTFLKRVDVQADTVILKSDNPAYAVLIHKKSEIGWMYRVEAIIPK